MSQIVLYRCMASINFSSADTVHAQILEVSSSCAIFNEHAVNVDKRILIANSLNVARKNRKQFYSLRPSATGCYATLRTRCFGRRVAPQALRPIVNQALKMRCDDRTNHRSLQCCDRSRRRFSATVTLKSPFLQLCNHVLPPVLLCKQCEHASKLMSTSWSNLLLGSVHWERSPVHILHCHLPSSHSLWHRSGEFAGPCACECVHVCVRVCVCARKML